MNHLISHSAGGVLLHFHLALIGVMVMYLKTGFRPSQYMVSLLSLVGPGATLKEILPIQPERERQSERHVRCCPSPREKELLVFDGLSAPAATAPPPFVFGAPCAGQRRHPARSAPPLANFPPGN